MAAAILLASAAALAGATPVLKGAPPAIPAVEQERTAAPMAPREAVDPRAPLAPLRVGQPAASAQALAPVSTLSEAIALAYRTNPRLLAQRATLRATDHRVPQAMAGYGPSLNVTGTMGYTYDRNDSIFGTTSTQKGWAN